MKKLTLSLFALIVCASGFTQLVPTYNDVWIPMRDGELLQADVYIPDGVTAGEVILIQTPYNKNLMGWSLPMGVGMDLDSQPFIFVIVDWRGFFGSFSADLTDFDRGEDGYDICQWISEQSWHNERIGTWGASALGGVQYNTMRQNHPNHTCAVPLVATGHQSYDSYFYGGVLEEARLNTLDALGYGLLSVVLANPFDNLFWSFLADGSWFPSDIQIPTLQIGGWYDHNIDKMIDFYTDSRNIAAPSVRDEQWLLVGPWVHGGTGIANVGSAIQGELSYSNAEYKSDTMAWEFMQYYLLDADNGWEDTDLITYYEMGGNDQWLSSNEDNIHAAESGILYLDQAGKLSGTFGAGNSTFVCDPSNPSPSIGGATLHADLDQGPYDQSSLESRSDLLSFATSPLVEPVSITGRISIDLYVESDRPDGDIAIRLIDEYPDGRNMLITDGIKRLRFRNDTYGEEDQVFMTPGEVYLVTIDLPFTNYTWLPGHNIKILVSGNHAIRFDVNLQDGGEMYVDGTPNNANIFIHHSVAYPSKINLPGSNPSLGISQSQKTNYKLYPNPVLNTLFIDEGDWVSYQIRTILGHKVCDSNTLMTNTVDVSELPTGLYIIQLKNAEGYITEKKFIKN